MLTMVIVDFCTGVKAKKSNSKLFAVNMIQRVIMLCRLLLLQPCTHFKKQENVLICKGTCSCAYQNIPVKIIWYSPL